MKFASIEYLSEEEFHRLTGLKGRSFLLLLTNLSSSLPIYAYG
jgi:hypothetical protein